MPTQPLHRESELADRTSGRGLRGLATFCVALLLFMTFTDFLKAGQVSNAPAVPNARTPRAIRKTITVHPILVRAN
jgi:hypothetical protein